MRNTFAAIGILTVALGFAYLVASRPMDFRVYHYGARGVFDGTRPVYGLTSGLGWPMHYRYPPLFLLLFAPLAMLPLGVAAGVWVVGKVAALVGLVERGPKMMSDGGCRMGDLGTSEIPHPTSAIRAMVFMAPYLIEDFRYGNAQFYVVALTIVALLLARQRPLLAAGSLALGISLKVWPLFFVPYLAVRRDWKVISWTMLFVLLLALVPSFYFGFQGNLSLLSQWFSQEFQTQLSDNEIWFPNQSLRGVMMRYLTIIDYSQAPDPNYPNVNILALDPGLVRLIWMAIAGATYLVFLVIANRTRETEGRLEHGLAFCLIALLEPFTQKYALSLLLWPALIAGGFLVTKPVSRILLYTATVFVLVQPLVPGSTGQRLLQVLGMDFAAVLLLTAALVYPIVETRSGRIL